MTAVLERDPADLVDRLVRRLADRLRPERIVLFGSYASGQPAEDSDIDMLIVLDTPSGFFERLVEARRAVQGLHPGVPFDPLVLTPRELRERLDRGDQFIEEILEKGRVLYAA